MGFGDDDEIVRLVGNIPPVHPALLARPDVRVALAGHDLGVLFRVLNENGWSQRGIASARARAAAPAACPGTDPAAVPDPGGPRGEGP